MKAFGKQRADPNWKQPVPDEGDYSQAKINIGRYFSTPEEFAIDLGAAK